MADEAMQFTYFRIPCQLITHPRFKHLSTDSMLLYRMLLDRMSLSIKNEWYDDTGRVYIYYTVDEICSSLSGLGGSISTAATLPSEIMTAIEGVGLLESIPLWLVSLLGTLFITVMSIILLLTVYGRFPAVYVYRPGSFAPGVLCRSNHVIQRQGIYQKLHSESKASGAPESPPQRP